MRAYQSGIQTLAAMLPRYDAGWWSLYSLYPHRLRDLAKPIYHRFHLEQLRVLARLTSDARFADFASRWSAYDTAANVGRALAQKALFVAAGRKPVGAAHGS
jgi:hypothetical protein